MTREVIICCIIEFFGEHAGHLIKEFKTGIEQLEMAVIVTKTATSSDCPKDIGIVVKGAKVVTGLEGVPKACCVSLGLTYALNLHYPRHLNCTFEVLQKLFLELDASKLSKSLRSKLLYWQEKLFCRLELFSCEYMNNTLIKSSHVYSVIVIVTKKKGFYK
ncbi:Processive diacylglycerol beta-glycosyltransferase [Labeo rohita]|uniref:Processive diacylglycerol beta-glycosyltransferase n=1 Tax=Labeo rohita TaxID=84645 RepID=A0ABQ8MST0_LABRO|nr:Processive diacylglycerol beta-glycosyltransferase [Labeo rohita]